MELVRARLRAIIARNKVLISSVFLIDFSLLLQRPSVLVWMEQSVEKIVSERENAAAYTFTCRLLALVTANTEQFAKLNQQNIYSKYVF